MTLQKSISFDHATDVYDATRALPSGVDAPLADALVAELRAGGQSGCSTSCAGCAAGRGFLFADRGEFVAKGLEEPMRVYEVNWRG